MHNSDIFAVILAGGSGTRFWPVSRKARPKQFLALGSTEESLIQSTARRITPLLSQNKQPGLLVVTNQELSSQVNDHVPDAVTIAEPCGRNTAASIGLAAIRIAAHDPQAIMIVLPADHSVADEGILREVLGSAVKAARDNNALVTIGIRPEGPNTAYGYIKRGQRRTEDSFNVDRFFEKPNLERAIEYCANGNFYWNSGMFVWKASTILAAFEKYMPSLHAALLKIQDSFNSADFENVLKREFEKLESISIDFGVLEHADNCMVVDAKPFGWNDVGSWDAWAHHFIPDKSGNVCCGEILQVQSKNCIVWSTVSDKTAPSEPKSPEALNGEGRRLIALLGVENLVVVDTADAVLICDRSTVQDVKLIVDSLRQRGRSDLL